MPGKAEHVHTNTKKSRLRNVLPHTQAFSVPIECERNKRRGKGESRLTNKKSLNMGLEMPSATPGI